MEPPAIPGRFSIVLQCSYADDSTSAAISCGTSSCGSGGTAIARYSYDVQPSDAECGGPGRIGQLTTVLDVTGGECWSYDIRGRVTTQKKTIYHSALATTGKTQFTYDEADHVTSVQYPDSGLVPQGYQADGLPDSIANVITGAEYDVFGRATRIVSARNTEDLYGFDPTGANNFRLETIQGKQTSTGTLYLNLAHTYWPRGKLKEVIDYRDVGTARSNAASYCYDGLGRLTKVDRDPVSGSNPCAGSPDESFAHDGLGNLTAKNGSSFGFSAGPHQPTSFGAYGAISYDGNGSRTVKDQGSGAQDELVYDARGLLTQVKSWSGGSVTSSQTNLYDYAGARVVRAPSTGAGTTIRTYNRYADAGGGNLTKYFYLGDRMVATWIVAAPSLSEVEPELLVPPARIELPPGLLYPAAGVVLLLLFLPFGRRRRLGVRVSLARSASVSMILLTTSLPVVLAAGCGGPPPVRLFHVDRLGSTQVVTDYYGAIYRQMRYYAYGEIRGRFNAAGNPANAAEDARFEFTGYETDFAGLDYAGERFFDPELGQFGTHDPAGQYPSPYAYGPGDPINGSDPSGGFWEIIVIMALQQIAAAIDTYRATHDSTKAWQAGFQVAINQNTLGIYGQVKAIGDDELGHYMANYYANALTGGIYGAVQAFNDGQIATGIVGAASAGIRLGQLAYGIYSQFSSSQTVSGIDLARNAYAAPEPDSTPAPPLEIAAGVVILGAVVAPEVALLGLLIVTTAWVLSATRAMEFEGTRSGPQILEMGRGKGERGKTAKPEGTDNPFKHMKPDPKDPSRVRFKDPTTGKKVAKPKPPGFDEYWKGRR